MANNNTTKKGQWSLTAALNKELQSKTKSELIDLIENEAKRSDRFASELEEKFKITKPLKALVTATKSAIAVATDFDERDRNHNFDIDYDAYMMVQRNFQQLIDGDYLDTALALAVELMRQGSYQVESSDEGLMTEDIEECLQVVTKEIYRTKLHKGPGSQKIVKWCRDMAAADRVEFIFEEELSKLKNACV